MRITPAAISFWILARTFGLRICSCSAAGSDCACWRMDCMTGSAMMLMICLDNQYMSVALLYVESNMFF